MKYTLLKNFIFISLLSYSTAYSAILSTPTPSLPVTSTAIIKKAFTTSSAPFASAQTLVTPLVTAKAAPSLVATSNTVPTATLAPAVAVDDSDPFGMEDDSGDGSGDDSADDNTSIDSNTSDNSTAGSIESTITSLDDAQGGTTGGLIDHSNPIPAAPSMLSSFVATNNLPQPPSNRPFQDLYICVNKLLAGLLQSLDVYWNTTPTTSEKSMTPTTSCDFSNPPSATSQIMQGFAGDCFGHAFLPGSLSLQIFDTISSILTQYTQGMLLTINENFYKSVQAQEFISPKNAGSTNVSHDNLYYIDQLWKNAENIMNTAFKNITTGQSYSTATLTHMQSNIHHISNAYTQKRYESCMSWYYNLLSKIHSLYNPTQFNNGLFSYSNLPDIQSLNGYMNAFLDACTQATQLYEKMDTAYSLSIGNFVLMLHPTTIVNAPYVFTNPQDFFNAIQQDLYNKLGDISYYAALVRLQRANEVAGNKTIPPIENSTVTIPYNSIDDVPTFLSSSSNNPIPPLSYVPGTQITATHSFLCAQQFFNLLDSYATSALSAFNFDNIIPQNTYIYDSLSPLVLNSYVQDGIEAPKQLLNDLMFNINQNNYTLPPIQKEIKKTADATALAQSTISNSTITVNQQTQQSLTTISPIMDELISSYQHALTAYYWYTAGNSIMEQEKTQAHAINIQTIIAGEWKQINNKRVCIQPGWQQACKELHDTIHSSANKQYEAYYQAGQVFYTSSSIFNELHAPDLSSYASTLGAYITIQAFEKLMEYYKQYYTTSFNTYNKYIKAVPFWGDIDKIHIPTYTFKNHTTITMDNASAPIAYFEKSLFNIFYYIRQAISATTQGYQQQLTFFLSQDILDHDQTYVNNIWPLQDALILLSNFQEAISPLLLDMPCALTSDNHSLLCGVDYSLIRCTESNISENQIAPLIIDAHKSYLSSYPLFKTMDLILDKYNKNSSYFATLKTYTQIPDLFQLSENSLNFSSFFLLHQARLYVSTAQRLLEGKPFFWEQGDPIHPASSYAFLLFAYAQAIYHHLGKDYNEHAKNINIIKNTLFKDYKLSPSFTSTLTKTLKMSMQGKTTNQINSIYEELNALATVLYLQPNNDISFDFLKLLSKNIISGNPIVTNPIHNSSEKRWNAQTTFEDYGIADWLSTDPLDIPHAHLEAALYYYQGYIIALHSNKNSIYKQPFLDAAQKQYALFISTVDNLLKKYHVSHNHSTFEEALATSTTAEADLLHVKGLMDLKNAYSYGNFQMQFLQYVFAPESSETYNLLFFPPTASAICKDFLKGNLNLPGMIGTVYTILGNNAFDEIAKNISNTLNKDLSASFAQVLYNYTQAQNYYGEAAISDITYQTEFIKAQQRLTNTYAYQNYLQVIPRYNISALDSNNKPITLPYSSNNPLREIITEKQDFSNAADTYNSKVPLYLYRNRTVALPPSVINILKPLISTDDIQKDIPSIYPIDSSTLLTQAAVPLYQTDLHVGISTAQSISENSLLDTPNIAQLTTYVTMYKDQYTSLLKGIDIGNQTLQGAITYNSNNTLSLYNEPLPAIPRFTGDIRSAIGYYGSGCSKLYSKSTTPLNYNTIMLLPSDNKWGQEIVNRAILNSYLSSALSLQHTIDILKTNKNPNNIDFITLQTASLQERLAFNFHDYTSLATQFQNPYEKLVATYEAMGTFLSNYGVNQAPINEMTIKVLIDYMSTNSVFICGPININTFKKILNNMSNSLDQIKTLAHTLENGDDYIVQAAKIYAQAFEYCAQGYAHTPALFPTTSYILPSNPDNLDEFYKAGDPYPSLPVYEPSPESRTPSVTIESYINWKLKGFPDDKQALAEKYKLPDIVDWKNAGTYYITAINPLSTALKDISSTNLQQKQVLIDTINTYYFKASEMFLHYATYGMLLFATNAYQECRCKTVNNVRETTALKTPLKDGGTPGYPAQEYPLQGPIPNAKNTPFYYTYPICQTSIFNGTIYNVLTPQTVYQGVASMEKRDFTAIKNECNQGMPSQYTVMYTVMQQMALTSLYYYSQAFSFLSKITSNKKLSKTEQDKRNEIVTKKQTEWIVDIFSSHPAFCNPKNFLQKNNLEINLPFIQIQSSGAASGNSTVGSLASAPITAFDPTKETSSQKTPPPHLALSNPMQFFFNTTRYWISQPVMFRDIVHGITQFYTLENYDIATSILGDIITTLKDLFIHTYLPTLQTKDAQYEVETMIENSQQDTTGTSASYF